MKFYIAKVTESADGSVTYSEKKELQDDFIGILYSRFEGLDDKGSAKNRYSEDYADSDKLRVYIGEEITRKATTLKLTVFFVGTERRKVYEDFYEYVKNGILSYYDTIRYKHVEQMYLTETKIKNEENFGSIPNMEVTFSFQNISGGCREITDTTLPF